MKYFNHLNVNTVEEAVSVLKDHTGKIKIMAGGTDLLGVLKNNILPGYPEALLNIKNIPGLGNIAEDSNGLKIGALAKLADIVTSPLLKEKYTVLAESAKAVATPQIRNMGTVGGNICQEVRCWYYRYPHSLGGRIMCLRKGSGPCPAVAGDNRYHSIFGGKGCYAVNPSDLVLALAVLNAEIKTFGIKGERTIPVKDFYGPLANALDSEEVVVEVVVPPPPAANRQQFLKYTLRKPVDFALVSVAALISTKDGICTEARIALGGVAPQPLRAVAAEQALQGQKMNDTILEEAADFAVEEAKPLSMNSYKVEITRNLVARALKNICSEKFF